MADDHIDALLIEDEISFEDLTEVIFSIEDQEVIFRPYEDWTPFDFNG